MRRFPRERADRFFRKALTELVEADIPEDIRAAYMAAEESTSKESRIGLATIEKS